MEILWHSLRSSERVAVEDPAWPVIPQTVAQVGLEPVPITVDEHGLAVAELEGMGVDAVVLSPAHQYPTGAVLAPSRRAELIAWARRRGAVIVEDDYDAEYRYDREPVASLQAWHPTAWPRRDHERKRSRPVSGWDGSWFRASLVGEMAAQHGVARAMPSVFLQATYATLLERGDIDRHLRRTRRRYQLRRNLLIDALTERLPRPRSAAQPRVCT